MHKAVYFHKTTFGLEAMLRQVLFLMRKAGTSTRTAERSKLIESNDFLNFHDGYIDSRIQHFANKTGDAPLIHLCKAFKERNPPKLIHQVGVLQDATQERRRIRSVHQGSGQRIKQLSMNHEIPVERWIWEDPKDIKFETMGPFVALADAGDAIEEEKAEMIRVREADGTVRNLVEDPRSILHHLSKLRFRMSRLYFVGPVDDSTLKKIKAEVIAWTIFE